MSGATFPVGATRPLDPPHMRAAANNGDANQAASQKPKTIYECYLDRVNELLLLADQLRRLGESLPADLKNMTADEFYNFGRKVGCCPC